MSALTDITTKEPLPEIVKEIVDEYVAPLFWKWFHNHEDTVILRVGWWIFKKTVHVSDLYSVFVLLFGADPTK